MMTQEEAVQAIQAQQRLAALMRMIGVTVADIQKTMYKRKASDCYENYEIDDQAGEITAHFSESRCGCCPNEELYVSFPFSYLWTENFAEIETEAHAERLRKAERAAAEKKRREEKAAIEKKEDNDLKTYERLKKKYEHNESQSDV